MGLRGKLFASFIVAILLSFSLVGFSLIEMNSMRNMSEGFAANVEVAVAVTQMSGLGPKVLKSLQASILAASPDQAEADWFSEIKGAAEGQLDSLQKSTQGENHSEVVKLAEIFSDVTKMFETELLPYLKANRGKFEPIKSQEILNKMTDKVSTLEDASLRLRNSILGQQEVEKSRLVKSSKQAIMIEISAMLFVLLILGIYIWRTIKTITEPLEQVIVTLNDQISTAESLASEFQQNAIRLSAATSEQASALQETSSTIEQISAMVSKTAESATQSGEAAHRSSDFAGQGREQTEMMIRAMTDIKENQGAIMTTVTTGNERIHQITDLIKEISTKTKVINDIVFQTKLLSFNASVEAARAGEQGKGFSVVAEEIGNLAQMSGVAANEINDLLNSSSVKVDSILNETRVQVENIIGQGQEKVDAGTDVAHRANVAIEKIVSEAITVNTMVVDIGTATREQATGVNEVTTAVSSLNRTMGEISSMSTKSADAAAKLNDQTGSLNAAVGSLSHLVWGKRLAKK